MAKWALESGLFVSPKISFLAEGYGNYNYLIEEKGQKFILRIKKNKEEQFIDSLEREFIFLEYFNQKGISFVPKIPYFSKKNNFQIQTFLEGEKVSQENLTDQQIELFAKQLYELFSLNIEDFFRFCQSKNHPKLIYYNPIESLKIYGFNRFNEAKKGDIDMGILGWINKKLTENYNFLEKSTKTEKYGFNWGDVQSKLFVNKNEEIFFYDFEHAMISIGSDLTYIKIHGKFDDRQFTHLIRCYSKYSGESVKDVMEEISDNEKIIRVNDVVWAVMKWSQSAKKEDKEKFKELTYRRIKLADE